MKFLKKFIACLTLTAVAFCSFALGASAAGTGFENAAAIKSTKKYTTKLAENEAADYIITVSKAGKLKISLTSAMRQLNLYVLDSNNASIEPTDYDSTSGAAWWVDAESAAASASSSKSKNTSDIAGGFSTICWDLDDEIYSGTITYEVSKGVYYIRFQNFRNSGENGKLTFSPVFPTNMTVTTASVSTESPVGTQISAMALSVAVGRSCKLGIMLNETASVNVKWSTSDSSIATVSSKGRVTAKKKGVAIITADIGTSTAKIAVRCV